MSSSPERIQTTSNIGTTADAIERTFVQFDVIDPAADIRLVAVDMDGTFLDAHGKIPEPAWAVIDQLQRRGITFAPASGRQYVRLREQFNALGDELTIIAENGTIVMRGEQEIYSNIIAKTLVRQVVQLVREHGPAFGAGLVLCGRREAYLEQPSAAFAQAVKPYYAQTRAVQDQLQVQDETIKVAIYCEHGSAGMARALQPLESDLQVVLSGEHWVDVMNHGAHKGLAIDKLQRELQIGAEQTAVFGDYLNDLEMLQAATHSFAMDNAHPKIRQAANFIAPPNTEHGVLQVLNAYLAGAASL